MAYIECINRNLKSFLSVSSLIIELRLMIVVLFQSADTTTPRVASSRSRTSDEPHIGKYKLLKTIGKGNFAKVKLAKHVPTGKEVSPVSTHQEPHLFIISLISGCN